MPATETQAITLTLNPEECEQLRNTLEQALREGLVEEHRTDALEFKEFVRRKTEILQRLIERLRNN